MNKYIKYILYNTLYVQVAAVLTTIATATGQE